MEACLQVLAGVPISLLSRPVLKKVLQVLFIVAKSRKDLTLKVLKQPMLTMYYRQAQSYSNTHFLEQTVHKNLSYASLSHCNPKNSSFAITC